MRQVVRVEEVIPQSGIALSKCRISSGIRLALVLLLQQLFHYGEVFVAASAAN
jgi:hypothetical protein